MVVTHCLSRRSQILMDLSWETEKHMSLSSISPCTMPTWPWNLACSLSVATSHTRSVASTLPVTSRCPPTAIDVTPPLWPLSSPSHRGSCIEMSHTRTVRSIDPENIFLCSTEWPSAITPSVCPSSVTVLVLGIHLMIFCCSTSINASTSTSPAPAEGSPPSGIDACPAGPREPSSEVPRRSKRDAGLSPPFFAAPLAAPPAFLLAFSAAISMFWILKRSTAISSSCVSRAFFKLTFSLRYPRTTSLTGSKGQMTRWSFIPKRGPRNEHPSPKWTHDTTAVGSGARGHWMKCSEAWSASKCVPHCHGQAMRPPSTERLKPQFLEILMRIWMLPRMGSWVSSPEMLDSAAESCREREDLGDVTRLAFSGYQASLVSPSLSCAIGTSHVA
mmetsp:Transcript_20531/g.49686  ORF Transcript_20531/g.49686 Transcript_20531/m.49686 type:complete len:388 (-) Transcript_20531:105-1268(-)